MDVFLRFSIKIVRAYVVQLLPKWKIVEVDKIGRDEIKSIFVNKFDNKNARKWKAPNFSRKHFSVITLNACRVAVFILLVGYIRISFSKAEIDINYVEYTWDIRSPSLL